MKKLAILINSMNGGGAERVVSILLEEFCKKYEVHLVLIHPGVAYTIPEGVSVHQLSKMPVESKNLKKFLSLFYLSYKYAKFCSHNKIDVSLSLLNRSNFINVLSKFFSKKQFKTVISERASTKEVYPQNEVGGKLARALVKWLYPKADLIITISKGIAIDLIKFFNVSERQVKVIYNPINLDKFTAKETSKKDAPFTFISVGRFWKQKNFELLIKAFTLLQTENCRLVVVGDGPLRSEIENLIKKFNLHDKVELSGFVSDVTSSLHNADCFVLTSDYEGFGNVILEALACGLPVISTDCRHGPSEILADRLTPVVGRTNIRFAEYGILVPLNNPQLLAQAMQEMMLNSERRQRYQDLARNRARTFDKSSIATAYIDALGE